nr:AP180 N-terminal homology (ANTH) domain [Tanacetum cinerariifolium]
MGFDDVDDLLDPLVYMLGRFGIDFYSSGFLDILLLEQRIVYQWLIWCFTRYYCGLELVLGWAKSKLTMYSSSCLIPKFKNHFGTSSTSSNPICFG